MFERNKTGAPPVPSYMQLDVDEEEALNYLGPEAVTGRKFNIIFIRFATDLRFFLAPVVLYLALLGVEGRGFYGPLYTT